MTDEEQRGLEGRTGLNLPVTVEPEGGESTQLRSTVKGLRVTDTALAALNAVNDEFALVVQGGRERYVRHILRPGPYESRYQFLDKGAFSALLENEPDVPLMRFVLDGRCGGEWQPVYKPLFKTWLQRPDRRTYHRIGFYPGSNPPAGVFNMWEGWPIKPRKGRWKRLLKHIYVVICRGNRRKFRWLLDWLSHVFQTTGAAERRSPVSPVVWGMKGSGKSIVFELVASCFGIHGMTVARKEHLTGKFNQHQLMCLFMVAEEAVFAHDRALEGAIKDFISRKSLTIEPKGVDAFTAANHCRAAFVSNEELPVPMTGDERRYQPFEVSSIHVGNASWFEGIAEEMKNGGLEAMFYDLLNRNYDEKLIRAPLSDDADLSAMKSRVLAPPVRFALHWFHNGHVVLTRRGDDLPSTAGRLEDNAPLVRSRSQVLVLNEDTNFVPSAELKGA